MTAATPGQADEPDAAVQAAAEILFRDYDSQYNADHLTWRDFADLARKALSAAQDARPAPAGEVRTCYCGTTATVAPGVFPHPDCDGSVGARPAPGFRLITDTSGTRHVVDAGGVRQATETSPGTWDLAISASNWPGIVQFAKGILSVTGEREPQPAPELAEPELTEHVSIRFPADMIAAARQLAAAEGMTVSAWIRREVEREAVRREQPAPGLAAKTGPRVDWARVSEAVADRERERDEARAELAALRELLDGIGVMAADAPEDGDSFGLLEEIAMRVAAADVPDTTPAGEWPDPENPVTGRTPGGAAPELAALKLAAVRSILLDGSMSAEDARSQAAVAAHDGSPRPPKPAPEMAAAMAALIKVTEAHERVMYAALIDIRRGDPGAAKHLLGEQLDGWDGPEWNGTEAGAGYLERTRGKS